MEEIAVLTGVTAAEVQGTCSFYTMFKRRPCGKFVVSVCTNVTCLVTGGPEVLDRLRSERTHPTPTSPSRKSSASRRAAVRRRCR